jgi:hypothetical protein
LKRGVMIEWIPQHRRYKANVSDGMNIPSGMGIA